MQRTQYLYAYIYIYIYIYIYYIGLILIFYIIELNCACEVYRTKSTNEGRYNYKETIEQWDIIINMVNVSADA